MHRLRQCRAEQMLCKCIFAPMQNMNKQLLHVSKTISGSVPAQAVMRDSSSMSSRPCLCIAAIAGELLCKARHHMITHCKTATCQTANGTQCRTRQSGGMLAANMGVASCSQGPSNHRTYTSTRNMQCACDSDGQRMRQRLL